MMMNLEPITYTRIDELEIKLSLKAWITEHDEMESDRIVFEDGTVLKPTILFEVEKDGKIQYLTLSKIKHLFNSTEEIKVDVDATETPSEYL